ncbi:MAG: hypothetical protein EOP92_16885 [Lysobacteraceae bacterium]|nr:MAG: hypothetical protein EOP92_16885 [Xanthomonadaceae bacterium]
MDMKWNRTEPGRQDAALEARRCMETKGKRRFARRLPERSARWRRMVAGSMAAGMAAMLASLLVLGEAAAAALMI